MTDEYRLALEQRATLIEQRITDLVERAVRDHEPWLAAQGPEANDTGTRHSWQAAARMIAAYRDRYGITGTAPLGNHSSFPGNISVFSGCTSDLRVGSYGDTWLGFYRPLITGSQYDIRLDSVNLNAHINANGYTFSNVVRSTTAHEFGHALRLGDHSNLPTRLMSSSRNRNVITGPTTTEVNESNSYY
ncbi:hypothetical protein [Promicromonospora sp. NPDC050249]|uniref:hypothetical protein n=1 Tax=Promicromonospora sp. NPDC050249 TaxID=3154743 RepID=UPI0033E9D9FA